ncbi:MAG: hypothetical protein ABI741_03400 [Ferruginibacter sp.]
MKKLFLMAMTAIMILPAAAQEDRKPSKKEQRRQRINAIARQEEEGVIKYKKHTAFGVKLTSDGYGGFFEIGRAQSVNKGLLFQLDIAERKHPRENKQSVYSNTAPEIFGKINFFYPIKLGVQKQFLFGNKGNKNGVSVTGNIGGGFIAGLLRPYMIQVEKNSQLVYVQYNSPDSTDYFLQPGAHVGGPNFGTGWKYLKVTPGIYVKPALRFDYGKYNEMVSAIEVGLAGEFYTKKIQQIIYVKQRQFFFSAYVSILFGRRR